MTNAEVYAFIAICEEMNISRAAEKLFISQSSLSTRIKTLESELGYRLFSRGKGQRSITLTPEGKDFLKLARKYVDIVEKMFDVGGHKKTLRVSTIESVSTFIMMQVFERFMIRQPEIELEIEDRDTKEAYESVQSGFTDLAFYSNLRHFPKLKFVPLFSENMTLICEPDSSLPDPVSLTALDLKNEVYIPWCDSFEDWHGSVFSSSHKPYIKTELISQLEHFVMKKDTWSIVPSMVADSMIRSGKAARRQTVDKLPQRTVFYSYSPGMRNKELIYEFLSCVREVITELGRENVELLT